MSQLSRLTHQVDGLLNEGAVVLNGQEFLSIDL